MKIVRIKKFNVKSVFKSVLLAFAIPWTIGVIILVLSAIASTITSRPLDVEQAIGSIIPFIFMPILYAAVAILFVLSYNWLAPKFGSLEIQIDSEEIP